MDGQKTQQNIKRHGGEMMLVIVLMSSENHGGKGNRESQGEISRNKEKTTTAVYQDKFKIKERGTLYGEMI